MDHTVYTRRTIWKEEVPSYELGKPRSVRIYAPPGYNELLSYPVLYGQDGEQLFNFGRAATLANRLILDEGMEPFIMVGVDVELPERTAEYSPEGDRFQAYCRFFAEELVPWVEQRVPARSGPDERLLAGDSLGGTVSLHLALDYPHQFRNVLSLSGAFLQSTHARIAEESDLSGLNMYMLIGEEETAVKTGRGTFDFLNLNRHTRRLLEQRQAAVEYVEKPGGHVWGFWQNELEDGLKYFF